MIRFAISVCLILWTSAAQAVPQSKVYAGQEAAALRCANTLALTAIAMADTGLIKPIEKEVLLQITVTILDRHVSGTWRQKKAALEVVRDRRDVEETLDDYRRFAQQCLRQFPIN